MMGHLGQCSSIHRHCSLQNCDMWTPANFNQFWLKAASPFRILAWAKIGLVKLSFMPVKVRFFSGGREEKFFVHHHYSKIWHFRNTEYRKNGWSCHWLWSPHTNNYHRIKMCWLRAKHFVALSESTQCVQFCRKLIQLKYMQLLLQMLSRWIF